MSQLISENVTPHGGFYFVENGRKLTAGSREDLVKLLRQHRESNGIAEGDPEKEIEDQICARWPVGCRGGSATFPKMVSRFVSVVQRMLSNGWQLVDLPEAETRAAICVSCPKNLPSHEARKGTCGKCNKTADAVLAKIGPRMIGNRTTSLDSQLKTCAACGCDNKIQIWIPLPILAGSIENKDVYWSQCWKIK